MIAEPNPSVVTNKASLRRLLRLQRQALGKEYRLEAALKVKNQLLKRLEGLKNIASYCAVNEELDTLNLNKQLAQEGRLLLPKTQIENIAFYRVLDLKTLVEGDYKIQEPNPEICPVTPIEEIEAILVPGIAFDSLGNRLGYGKGFYDRLLANKNKNCLVIGIAYKEQLVRYPLPVEEHDQSMSLVLTD